MHDDYSVILSREPLVSDWQFLLREVLIDLTIENWLMMHEILTQILIGTRPQI